jgi:RNA polymerase sigma-70 factor (ECF subfamily)
VSRPLSEQTLIVAYRDTIRPLYAYVSRRVGGDRTLAEDIVQETWVRALDAWPAKGLPDSPLAWLQHVAHNILVSHFRRQPLEPIQVESIDLADRSLASADADTVAVIGWGLARVGRSHADLLEAFYFEDKGVREIAAERSLSERAVEGRLRRARAKLKKQLDRLKRTTVDRRATGGGTSHV